jgi:nitroreductase
MIHLSGALGLTGEQIDDVLTMASRAPSLHNAQPWRFRVTRNTIELHADLSRALDVVDPDGMELRIACGAALFNLRLALHGHGVRPIVTVLPDQARPDFVAVVRAGGHRTATPEQARLLAAIPLRRTNRHPFSDESVSSRELGLLRRAAVDEGAWLHVVADRAERRMMHELAAKAHREQMADPAFRAELAHWTAVTPDRRDGVPAAAGGPLANTPRSWVMRDFTGVTDAEGRSYEEEPAIAVLSSHLSGRVAEINAGQALERVLLTATAEGLAVSFLSQVVEVPAIRDQLRRLIHGTRPPQAVLRIGRGWPVQATPRRELAELVMVDEPVSAETHPPR